MKNTALALLRRVNKDLRKFGCIQSTHIEDFSKIHFFSLQNSLEPGNVLVEVVNAHNCYLEKEQKMYRSVCEYLISLGYDIKANKSDWYITVKGKQK